MSYSRRKDEHRKSGRGAVRIAAAGGRMAIAVITAAAAGAALAAVATAAAAADVTTAGTATAVQPDTTIAIRTFGTNLEFTPSRIAAKQGTTVRIRYTNEGTLPHNFVIVKEEADIDVLGPAAFQAGDTGFIPVEHEDRMIAHSELVVPGSTVEITFTMPPPGEYFFVCLYPGHYNMMIGTIRSLP